MAYCENCGTEVSPAALSCPKCGHPFQRGAGAPAARRTEGTAIASLVLGVLGIVGCLIVAPILAIVFGTQARSKLAADPALEGEGMAKAGVVLGWVGLGLSVLWILLLVLLPASST